MVGEVGLAGPAAVDAASVEVDVVCETHDETLEWWCEVAKRVWRSQQAGPGTVVEKARRGLSARQMSRCGSIRVASRYSETQRQRARFNGE